jgi:hypothetical protein
MMTCSPVTPVAVGQALSQKRSPTSLAECYFADEQSTATRVPAVKNNAFIDFVNSRVQGLRPTNIELEDLGTGLVTDGE